MDLTAIGRIARARWLILVAAAVIAGVVVGRLAQYQIDNIPTHEAAASVAFTHDPTSLDLENFNSLLEDQLALATEVNSDVVGVTPGPLLPWSTAEVDLHLDENRLSFTARGYSQEEANDLALVLRDKYLSLSSVGAGQERISQEIDQLTAEIAALRASIAERQFTGPPSEEETQQAAMRAALEARITSLQSQWGALGVELMNPVLRSAAEVQAEIDRVLAELVRLQLELGAIPLPADPAAEQATDEQLLLDQLRLTQLETRWTALYTQLRDLNALTNIGEVEATPISIDAPNARNNQMLAVLGAVVVALIAVVGIERTRGIVWSSGEVKGDVPVVSELPPRQLRPFRRPSNDPWYISVPAGKRKAAVQLIRSRLDAYQNAAVAFQGTGVFEGDTLDLSADVAMSAAVSGRNILLIDATFTDRSTQVEYGSDGDLNLMALLEDLPGDPHAAMAEIKSALVGRTGEYRNLWSLRSGAGPFDAGDVLASPGFEMLLEVAREQYDLVLVAGSGYDEPTSHILAQRTDFVILVGSIGHTVDRLVEAAERDFKARRASLLGIVMVRRRRSRFKRWLTPRMRRGIWNSIDWLRSSGRHSATDIDQDTDVEVKPSRTERRAEAKHLKAERAAVKKAEAERIKAERLAIEQAEIERLATEKAAAEKAAAEQAEAARVEAEEAAAEKAAAKRAEAERLAQEKAAEARAAAERAEAARIAAEKAEAERIAAEEAARLDEATAALEESEEITVDLDEEPESVRGILDPKRLQDDRGPSGPQRFLNRLRSLREPEPVYTGFQASLERFGVSDPTNLSENRYAEVEGVVSAGSSNGGEYPREAAVNDKGESGGGD